MSPYPGHHDHRQANTQLGQLDLEFETTHTRQADVDNDAPGLIRERFRRLGSQVPPSRTGSLTRRAAMRRRRHVYHRSIVRLKWHGSGPYTVTLGHLWHGRNRGVDQTKI
jgi:hypothetical protein